MCVQGNFHFVPRLFFLPRRCGGARQRRCQTFFIEGGDAEAHPRPALGKNHARTILLQENQNTVLVSARAWGGGEVFWPQILWPQLFAFASPTHPCVPLNAKRNVIKLYFKPRSSPRFCCWHIHIQPRASTLGLERAGTPPRTRW